MLIQKTFLSDMYKILFESDKYRITLTTEYWGLAINREVSKNGTVNWRRKFYYPNLESLLTDLLELDLKGDLEKTDNIITLRKDIEKAKKNVIKIAKKIYENN